MLYGNLTTADAAVYDEGLKQSLKSFCIRPSGVITLNTYTNSDVNPIRLNKLYISSRILNISSTVISLDSLFISNSV